MSDYTYDWAAPAARSSQHVASAANWVGAAMSLTLVAGIGVWGYKLIARDVSGVPVVQAAGGPMRVAPENPGGTLAAHQGLAVNRVAGVGTTAPPADRLVLAPRPAGLGEEDVALGVLAPLDTPRLASVTVTPSLAEEEPALPVASELVADAATSTEEELDPIQALANQLAAGVAPLSALEPGEDAPVKTELGGVAAAEAEPAAAPVFTGPGLARSLRPRLRPSGLQVAAATSTAVTSDAAPVETTASSEIDPASLPAGTRLVQIGAFDSPETARAEWTRLEARFGDYLYGKNRVIQRASSGGRVFYRLRAHGFADLSDARRFCSAFVAQNVDCIPVVTR